MRALSIALAALLTACNSPPAATELTGYGDLFPYVPYRDAGADGARSDGPRREAASPLSPLALAAHWAPVWYQDSDDRDYLADRIVAYDFDGDTRSDNNWENLTKSGVDLSARIYYSIVETTTHWFILYADFHPRDWAKDCEPLIPLSEPCHENDMEGAMVVVRKDGSSFGAFLLLYTEAHNQLHIYTNEPGIGAGTTAHLETTKVTFEGGSHPELYVESKGHGVCALYYSQKDHCEHPTTGTPPEFGGGDGLVYRYKGKAETPTSGNDRDVGYELVRLESTLWARRKDICNDGCTFDTTMIYAAETIGKAFDGDTYGDDKANPPWAWDDPDDGPVYRGDLFFRPAEAVLTHLKGLPTPFSKTYVSNPFL